jgi:hypothetical protein
MTVIIKPEFLGALKTVMPAQAGIQLDLRLLGSRLRGSDGSGFARLT